ncbi:MAG: T9SS type A sorting domain-containing protein, partial [Winogradskyella sp.]
TADPCSNGMMDPGEEGVDCGGTCPNACPGAAVVLQDFESGGLGAPFGNLGSATIVADPEVMGTRGMVAELIASTAGEVWQGTNIDIDQDVDLTTDKTMSIDVYSTTAISILVKVTGSGDGGPDSSVEANHTGAGWETLTVTFNTGQDGTATANGTYTNFVVYPNWDSMANGYINPAIARTVYVDNISGIPAAVDLCSNGMMDPGEEGVDCGGTCPNACPAPPMVAAPTPPARNPQDVVSIYSDAYAAIPGINLDAPFCGAGAVTETTAGGDSVLAYNGQACQGIDFDSERQDITGLTNLHVDLFIEVGTDLVGKVFNILVVNPTGDTPINIDINALMPAPVPGTWYSYDMPVSISDPIARQITVVSNLNDAVWYDNLYLYSNTVVNQDCTGAIPLDLDGSTVDFGNVGATDSGVDASCDSGIISDVWYSFVGTITEEAYFQTNAPNLSVWSGACGSLTEIACNPGTSAVPVMDGVTYYVRVNDDGTARAPGNFTLAANESTFSNNDFNLSSIRVYPNPTNDSWNIEGANVTIDTIEVYDILGKRVQTLSPNSQQTAIDASGLKTGLYLAKLYSGNAVRTIKLVKN